MAVLLNDTDALEKYCHFGCSAVVRTIREQLRIQGISVVTSINTAKELSIFEKRCRRLDLVIINGEGTMHEGNARRANWLLNAASRISRAHCCPAILMNTHWSLRDAKQLSGIDGVYARDQRSVARLKRQGVTAQMAPDLSLFGFSTETGSGLCVQDSVVPSAREQLAELAIKMGLPLDCCSLDSIEECRKSPRAGSFGFRLFREAPIGRLITGRFHGVCYAISAGIPFFTVASNTDKVESILEELNLSIDPTLTSADPDWSIWTAEAVSVLKDFRISAKSRISDMFDEISSSIKSFDTDVDV